MVDVGIFDDHFNNRARTAHKRTTIGLVGSAFSVIVGGVINPWLMTRGGGVIHTLPSCAGGPIFVFWQEHSGFGTPSASVDDPGE